MKKFLLVLTLVSAPLMACSEESGSCTCNADEEFLNEAIDTDDFDAIDDALEENKLKEEEQARAIAKAIKALEDSDHTVFIVAYK